MSNLFNILFKSDNSCTEYAKAKNGINRVTGLIQMEFPNVSSVDIITKKNEWVEIENDLCTGVNVMGLHSGDDYTSVLVHYTKESEIKSHTHNSEWEMIMILDGSAIDLITGNILNKGDVYVVPKGVLHNVVSKSEECYVYTMFTSKQKYLKISETEKTIAKKLVLTAHSE